MSSSSRKNNTKNTANSESVNNKNHLRRIYEKQKSIIRTLEDSTNLINSDLKKLYNTLRKTAKNYVRLVALKHKFDFYGLYTGDIIKTITLCGEEYEKMALTMNDLSKQREVIYNTLLLYIQDIEYTTLVKNSNIDKTHALVETLHKNYTKRKKQQKRQNEKIQKQNNTNRPINTIQNSLEFSNKNTNSRR
jgi:hypothetical protein